MITLFFKRAIDDIFKNRFLNLVTIITISLSILIASAFILFFVNTSDVINSWKKGLRIMAYLESGITNTELEKIKGRIRSLGDVDSIKFISKQEALSRLTGPECRGRASSGRGGCARCPASRPCA